MISPALLFNFTRHKVKDADYPAILPIARSQQLFNRELTRDEQTVRGTIVTGLTQADIDLLDIFEGDEYIRTPISAYYLRELEPLNQPSVDLVTTAPPPVPPPVQLGDPVQTETYVWAAPASLLIPELWSFEIFVRDNAWKWIGKGAEENKDYREVDRRREMNGTIVRPGDDAVPSQ